MRDFGGDSFSVMIVFLFFVDVSRVSIYIGMKLFLSLILDFPLQSLIIDLLLADYTLQITKIPLQKTEWHGRYLIFLSLWRICQLRFL